VVAPPVEASKHEALWFSIRRLLQGSGSRGIVQMTSALLPPVGDHAGDDITLARRFPLSYSLGQTTPYRPDSARKRVARIRRFQQICSRFAR
jgi:hypothetical protein